MKIKNIIWDFNGTIINDLDLCLNILNEMLIDKGLAPVTKQKYLDIFTFPIKEYYELAGFDFSIHDFSELTSEFIEKYQEASLSCPLHKHVVKTLAKLQKLGYHQYLLSASQIDNLMQQVNHFKIPKYFDGIIGIDNVEAKGKIEVGLNYFKNHNLSATNTIFIGDTLHDVEVANALNCAILLYSKGHQAKHRFGLIKTFDNYKQLVKEIQAYEKKT